MIDLSPGTAQAAFELLRLIEVQGLTPDAVILGLGRVNRIPADAVLELVQTLNWAVVEGNGLLVLSDVGIEVGRHADYATQARRTLLDYARIVGPAWLQNAPFGRSRVLQFAPVGARQLMIEAEVAQDTDDTVVVFWDELAALARRIRDEHLSAIGRRGERLTLAHETRRTGRAPRWVAIDSNTDGFDVLSVRAPDDPASLTIEVKTSSVGTRGDLFLTRGEWDAAVDAEAHVFHLWDVSKDAAPRLAVVEVQEMASHVPADGGDGIWDKVRVPFAAFASQFNAVHPEDCQAAAR